MKDFKILTGIVIFFTYLVIDILYASYIIYVGKRQPVMAATISMFIYGLLAYGVISYSSNPYYLIPLAIGAWCGTFLVVKYKK